MSAIGKDLPCQLAYEPLQPDCRASRVVQANSSQGQPGCVFEPRQPVGRFAGGPCQHADLIAQRAEEFTAPGRIRTVKKKLSVGEQIEKALGGNFRPPGRKRVMKIAFEPMLRQLQRKLTRNIAAGRFEMTKPLEAVKRGREFGAGKRLIENRTLSDF